MSPFMISALYCQEMFTEFRMPAQLDKTGKIRSSLRSFIGRIRTCN